MSDNQRPETEPPVPQNNTPPAEPPSLIPDEPPQIPDSMRQEKKGWSSTSSLSPPGHQYSPGAAATIRMIEEGLRDPSCTQIDGYGPGRFSAQINGRNMMLQGSSFASGEEYSHWVRAIVEGAGSLTNWDRLQDEKMGVLELADGSRLTVFLPPIAAPWPTFSLRKHTAAKWKATELEQKGTMDERMSLFLQACVAARVNILFVGGMGAGKSTLMRSLIQGVGDDERLSIIEQVPELSIDKPLVNEYLYQPTIEGMRLGDVLDFNLYNGIDRLIVGEIHLQGITKMLETMILTEGSMSTYHAYSTEQAGERMKLALQIENPNISAQTAAAFIRQALELVVVVQNLQGQRRITQITEVDWRASAGRETLTGGDIFIYDKPSNRFLAKNAPSLGRIEMKLEKYQIPTRHDWFIDVEDLKRFRRRAEG